MENKNCEAKKRILSHTKFLNQILNFQTKIQRCVELSGTLEYLVNWSLFPNNFEKLPEENLRNFEIERALEKINNYNHEIQMKMTAVMEIIKPPARKI
jgi:hypothetical protein